MKALPGWAFQILFVTGIAVFIAKGVQWQVGRKQRTNFNDQVYIEDSSLGKGLQPYTHTLVQPKHLMAQSKPAVVKQQCLRYQHAAVVHVLTGVLGRQQHTVQGIGGKG
jgi:hypothetical protein